MIKVCELNLNTTYYNYFMSMIIYSNPSCLLRVAIFASNMSVTDSTVSFDTGGRGIAEETVLAEEVA